MNVKQEEYEDFSVEDVICLVMFVLFVGVKILEIFLKIQFVVFVEMFCKKFFKLNIVILDVFFCEVFEVFKEMMCQLMKEFIDVVLLWFKLIMMLVDEIFYVELQGVFFVCDVQEEDVVVYDKFVVWEWVCIIKGNVDDLVVLVIIFLNVVIGYLLKVVVLFKDVKNIIVVFCDKGFDFKVVVVFIDDYVLFE